MKPFPWKNYGSIGHLPNSKLGPSDSSIPLGQAKICLEKKRDNKDKIIIQEKLDGTNVGVARLDGKLFPINRSGHLCVDAPRKMHRMFHDWVMSNQSKFDFLKDGYRVCGEWLVLAHGIKYKLPHEPFVAFDIIEGNSNRVNYNDFINLINGNLITPNTISTDEPMSVEKALSLVDISIHGSQEDIEGLVYRVERNGKVDFLAKYVQSSHIPGKYFNEEIWLWQQ